MNSQIEKPKYFGRTCSDKELYISSHGKNDYIANFPLYDIKTKKIVTYNIYNYDYNRKNIFKEKLY